MKKIALYFIVGLACTVQAAEEKAPKVALAVFRNKTPRTLFIIMKNSKGEYGSPKIGPKEKITKKTAVKNWQEDILFGVAVDVDPEQQRKHATVQYPVFNVRQNKGDITFRLYKGHKDVFQVEHGTEIIGLLSIDDSITT